MAPSKGRKQQHVGNQVQRLLAEGIPQDRIYVDDGRSGKLRSRPEWDKLLPLLRKDDVLVATKLDRIGRSSVNLVDVVNVLGERGVQLRMLDQPIDTSSAMGKFFFQVMAALAELEAELTRERTLEGLAAAEERHGGKIPCAGRPSPPTRSRPRACSPARACQRPASRRLAESAGQREPATGITALDHPQLRLPALHDPPPRLGEGRPTTPAT